MVSVKYISEIIEKSIKFIEKCRTLNSMKEQLSHFSRDEIIKSLEGRLTRLEWDDYNSIYDDYQETYDEWMEHIKNGDVDKDKIPEIYSWLDDFFKEYYEDNLFKYERRIIEDYYVSDSTPPAINFEEYVSDKSVPINKDNLLDRNTIGDIESEMIKYQEDNYNLTQKESYWIEAYYLDNYIPLKHRINHDYEVLEEHLWDDYELAEFNREFPSMLRHMDNAINKQEGLLHPTILYHGGLVDISVPVGGHGVWKNYISTSFQEASMKSHNKDKPDYWEVLIYAPGGTKGLCGNIRRPSGRNEDGSVRWDDSMGMNQYTFEHEYLLGRNTGYTVVGMDYENHRQIVILDEP